MQGRGTQTDPAVLRWPPVLFYAYGDLRTLRLDASTMTAFDFNTATPDEIRVEADRRKRAKNAWQGGEEPLSPAMQRRKEMLREKDVQQRVIKLYVSYRCKVRVYSQPRKAKYLTPGQADLQILSPLRVWDETERLRRVMWYHETKKPKDGRYSDDQLLFAADMRECGIDVIGGGTEEAQAQLDRVNIEVPL